MCGGIHIGIVYLYVFDTMADWEPGYLMAELGSGRYFKAGTEKIKVATVGPSTDIITTMGGVRIKPDMPIGELTTADAVLLVLPGGNTWMSAIHDPVFEKVEEFLSAGIVVSAICGATIGLAARGFLNDRPHTSNDPGYLKACCPAYRGGSYYEAKPAVCDSELVTATGIAPLEFAYETLKRLDLFSPATLEAWYGLYRTRDATYFYKLMGSLPDA